MTNYFELFDNRLSAIEMNQQEILAQLRATSAAPNNEIGGIELAQQVTRLSAARIYTLVSKRAIPHSKRGNRLTFNKLSLLDWLSEGNRKTVSQIDVDAVHLKNRKG